VSRHSRAYLAAARSARTLLADPAVAGAWDRPSSLVEMTVGALAAHLASQVVNVPRVLATVRGDVEVLPLRGHYERVTWTDGDVRSEVNSIIRGQADEGAAAGPEGVLSAVDAALAGLESSLAEEDGSRPVRVPSGPWALTVDDFLVTRMMEIAVHSDDLAVSVSLPTPDLPLEVMEPVLTLLIGLAAGRHGQAAVLRALARVERAPATINAL
jgi:hypothetical protein